MPRFKPPSDTVARLSTATLAVLYPGEVVHDEFGQPWYGKTDGTWERVGAERDLTPEVLGTLTATQTLPVATYRSIEGTVGALAEYELAFAAMAPGQSASVLITSVGTCTVSLPPIHWVDGSPWSGAMVSGNEVRINLFRAMDRLEGVWSRVSATPLSMDPIPTSGVFSTNALFGGSTSNEALSVSLARASAQHELIQDDIYAAPESLGSISGTVEVPTSTSRRINATLIGNVALQLSAPTHPVTVVLRMKQDATGGRSVTMPSGIEYPDGVLPTFPTAANARWVLVLSYDGADWPWFAQVIPSGVPA